MHRVKQRVLNFYAEYWPKKKEEVSGLPVCLKNKDATRKLGKSENSRGKIKCLRKSLDAFKIFNRQKKNDEQLKKIALNVISNSSFVRTGGLNNFRKMELVSKKNKIKRGTFRIWSLWFCEVNIVTWPKLVKSLIWYQDFPLSDTWLCMAVTFKFWCGLLPYDLKMRMFFFGAILVNFPHRRY